MRGHRAIRRAVAILYVAAVLVLALNAGEPQDISWWLIGLPFIALIASPALAGLWSAGFLRGLAYHLYCIAVTAVLIYGYRTQWYVMFIGPPDAQNALVLLFVPVYQLAAIGLMFLIAKLVDRYVRGS